MNAADTMTREVITASPTMALEEAVQLMLSHRISGLPVIDSSGALVGIVTEGDLLRRSETHTEQPLSWWRAVLLGTQRLADRYVHSHARQVGEVMTRSVVSVAPGTPLADVVALMEARGVRRLPVVQDGKLVGIVSRADLLRALERFLQRSSESVACQDSELRRRVLRQLATQRWVPAALVDIGVNEGVVELRGFVLNEGQREALRVLAENTPGVRRVIDNLVWMEPYSGFTLQLPTESGAAGQSPAAVP